MKSIKTLILVLFGGTIMLAGCNQSPKQETTKNSVPDPNASPMFKFEETLVDFGKIKEGDVVEHKFKFINVGNTPLTITNVQAQCGCTIPIWPKQPIAPGKEDIILVKFDSKGKSGAQQKQITIMSNSNNGQDYLSFKAEVEKADSTATK